MIDLFLYIFPIKYSDKEKRRYKIKRHRQLLYNGRNWLKNSQQDTPLKKKKNFATPYCICSYIYIYIVHDYYWG